LPDRKADIAVFLAALLFFFCMAVMVWCLSFSTYIHPRAARYWRCEMLSGEAYRVLKGLINY
jgi:ABC-type cobalamin transport system permease subunit